MYLVEVEFYRGYVIPYNTKAEYINVNKAIFRVKDYEDLLLFIEESTTREEVKHITTYRHQ